MSNVKSCGCKEFLALIILIFAKMTTPIPIFLPIFLGHSFRTLWIILIYTGDGDHHTAEDVRWCRPKGLVSLKFIKVL